MNNEKFESAKNKILGYERQRNGIGTLSEKTLHAILKNYYDSNEEHHEIPINGYVADIYDSGNIIEIQTAGFNKLRNKLDVFLNDYKVTIVYPMYATKWMCWLDEETGTVSKKRKSPKKGNIYEFFYELYKIKMYLKNENIRFKIVMLDMEEIRLLNGWSTNKKRGSSRYDRIPIEIVNEISIETIEDYMQLLPAELNDDFDVKEYAKAAKVSERIAGLAVNVLSYTDTIKKVGKRGRAYLYKINEQI